MTVRTRFAPSPTGFLHIGGARTALFNLLFARHNQGSFLLRIEDTDIKRSTPEATAAILEGMDWLGLTSDEPPIFQRARSELHVACAEEMVASGAAFRCYVTPEELQARKDEGEAKRIAAKDESLSESERETLKAEADALLAPFRSPWRDGGAPPHTGALFTVRLRAPDNGEMLLEDAIQGDIRINASEIDDLVLLRADGTPTYMLAVVVDDHDMDITHVIRGDDHLRNAFRQIPIYQAMGWDVPQFAHLPMIHGPDGAKLSKRHGALGVEVYREMGYLPEAITNYLLRLGWSHGDQEFFSLEEAASLFSLGAVNTSPARMDFDKLADINAHYIQKSDDADLLALLLPFLETDDTVSANHMPRIEVALPHMKDRGDTLPKLAEAFAFLRTDRPLSLNKKARKALKGDGLSRLKDFRDHLSESGEWSTNTLEKTLADFCAEHSLSMGQIGPPLRAALTANLPAPDLGQVMAWLGQNETLARIDDQLTAAE